MNEEVIERGLGTFVEVGEALLAIRDGRLYREQHATFEDYCRVRWGWTRQHINRQIAAAETVGMLEPMGSAPVSERQARELAPLRDDPERMRQAWERATERTRSNPSARDLELRQRDLVQLIAALDDER